MEDKYSVLKKYFGYSAFREGQELMIDTILQGRDALGIMPTGAGKSMCFWVPALLQPGITLVVSPLISLMKDQVETLNGAGARAAYINSSLSPRQYQKALQNAANYFYKVIYVAPERLLTDGFMEFANQMDISMVTVDEAHCLSQWGQDFRPSYLKIIEFIRQLRRRPVVSAFTATATARVREDIVSLLELQDPNILVTGFDRRNLYFEVQKPADKFAALKGIMNKNRGSSGIIYCATRKTVEELCDRLCAAGFSSTRYHAGLTDEERRQNQDEFIFDKAQVIVATNAFGMGIDKSNVSFVVHYNMPKDMESYYQEAGRAGRDGQPAECILLYSGQDVRTQQFLIERESGEEGGPELRELMKQRERDRLKQMTFYCHTQDCLRSYLLKYFGEDSPHYCGNCSNCNTQFETVDITADARAAVSCVKETGQRFGVKTIVDTLRGSKNAKLLNWGLDKKETYGLKKERSEKLLREVLHYLVLEGYLNVTDGEYPVVTWGPQAPSVYDETASLQIKLPKEKAPAAEKATQSGSALFQQLRQVRAELARREGIPAYIVFSDATLADMCKRLPTTEEALLEVSGVGRVKMEKYGQAFLEALKDAPRQESEFSRYWKQYGPSAQPEDALLPISAVLQKAVSVLPEECKERPTVQKVSKWLEANGYLVNSGSGRRPGPRAAEIGLAAQQVKAKDGKWYQTNLYGEKAQAFLLEHMTQIME